MTEVSARTTAYSLDLLEQEGLDLGDLRGDSGLDLVRLRDPTATLDWDAFLTFLDRIETVCGPETLDTLGGRAILSRPTSGALRAFTRMASSEERQWRWIAERMAPALYRVPPGVAPVCTFERLPDGRFRMDIRIPDANRESERFMRWQLGIFRVIPRVVGEDRDPEIEVSIGARHSTFDITPGPKVGRIRRLRRRVGGLIAAYEEIENRQQLVEQATDRSIADQRSLAALSDVANAITQSTDFASTADRIVDAIVTHTDAVAATLYVLNDEETSLELAAVRSAGPTPPPQRIAHPTEVSRMVLESGRMLWSRSTGDIAQLDEELGRAVRDAGLQGFAVVPLGLHDTAIGTLGLGYTHPRPFSPDEERSLTTLGQTAGAALMAARHVARIEHEIDQRAETEARLRVSEERFRQIAENVDGVFYLFDLDTLQLLYVSPSYERLTGQPVEELLQGRAAFLDRVVPEDRDRVLQTMLALPETGGYELEYRIRPNDGRLISVFERVTLIAGQEGEGPRAVGYAQDVSRLREVEEQLRHVQKMDAVGRLAGGIAHDFNNLLTVILAYADVLQTRFDPEHEAHALAAEIASTGESAGRLTRGLLTLARQQPSNIEHVDVAAVVRDLEPMARRIAGPDIRVELDTGVDEAVVEMDRSQLEQVVLNLVVNACDAMPDGGDLAIRVRTPGAGGDEDRIVLTVSDTGHGMSLEAQRMIFDPFFSTKGSEGHSGLGLSIVDGIVEKAEGAIRVDSAEGQGASFDVFLPQSHTSMPRTRPSAADDPGGHETILLVEDDDLVRSATAGGLRARGYHVVEASGGESALAVLATMDAAPDLVLTDLRMPGMNGADLARELAEAAPGLSVLFMTGFPGEARPEGLTDIPVLVKPFGAAELGRAVRDQLDRSG